MDLIRVLIVEDHAVVREGTREVLHRDRGLDVVGEAGTGEEALRLVDEFAPDVVLLDLGLPDMSGMEVLREISARSPSVRVLVLSAYDDDDYVVTAIDAGAAGYLLKTVRGKEVVEAIHAVRLGQVILHPAVAEKLRHSIQGALGAATVPALSAREMGILRLAARGLRNKAIAHEMHISVRTVETHLSHILTKLRVSSRTEAVVYAAAHHWLALEQP